MSRVLTRPMFRLGGSLQGVSLQDLIAQSLMPLKDQVIKVAAQ